MNTPSFRFRFLLGLGGVAVLFAIVVSYAIQTRGVSWSIVPPLLVSAGAILLGLIVAVPINERIWSVVKRYLAGDRN